MSEVEGHTHNQSESAQSKPASPYAWLYAIFSALACFILLEQGLDKFYHFKLPTILNLVVYLVFYWIFLRFVFSPSTAKTDETVPHPALNWPISGPISKLGHKGMMMTAMPTMILSAFNPFQFIQQMKQLFGQAKISKRIKNREEEIAAYQNKVSYRLPFEGEWLVFNGGLKKTDSHSWDVLTQRYAFDFVKADNNYCRHINKGKKLSDYHCYGEPIVSAAEGEVVHVFDKTSDAPFVGYCFIDFLAKHFAGNHVIIKHAENEYGFYAHLIKGSIPIKVGDNIKRGELVGLCGHSGHSSEPHLHFHLQDRANLFIAMGLPIRFEDISIEGNDSNEISEICRGQRVRQLTK